MQTDETFRHIARSITELDNEVHRRVTAVERRLQAQANLMEEIERELDGIPDENLRRRVQQLSERYDDARDDIRYEVREILTYDLFDRLRILAIDVRHML
jgi:archaellum component FlaC